MKKLFLLIALSALPTAAFSQEIKLRPIGSTWKGNGVNPITKFKVSVIGEQCKATGIVENAKTNEKYPTVWTWKAVKENDYIRCNNGNFENKTTSRPRPMNDIIVKNKIAHWIVK